MTSGRGDGHRESLRALGLGGPPLEGLTAYLDRLAAWNHRVNLTGARTPAARVALLVAPVLPVVDRLEPGLLLDVGSGNGSPGLVLALLEPDRPVTLLEPRQRRWGFLLEAARAARRPVEVLRVRHDAYAGPRARNVTLRALVLPLAEMAPLVEVGGQVLTLGGVAREGGPFRTEGADELPGGLILRRYRRTP